MTDTFFLNVDLELEADVSLISIVREFGDDVGLLHHSESKEICRVSLEPEPRAESAEAAIAALCFLAENLSPETREIWNRCYTRIFDIGYRSGELSSSFRSIIHADTIKRVAALGAAIMITIYPPKQG